MESLAVVGTLNNHRRGRRLKWALLPVFAIATCAPLTAMGSQPSADGQQPIASDRMARVHYDEPGDGALWALGRMYKCRFAGDGFTYIPMLGPDAPRNYPLTLAVHSIEAGGRALPFTSGAPLRQGDRVTIDRGIMTEVYILTPDSVEQEFIFAQPPATGAEVKIRLAVHSDLTAAEAGSALRFSTQRGGVNYTSAVAVDAAARHTPLPTVLSAIGSQLSADSRQPMAADIIEITLSAALVADAAYPLTVDPILSTFTVASTVGSTFERTPDVSYDATSNTYLFVWEHNVSAVDGDVYSERYDAGGAAVPGSFAAIDMTATNWRNPSVANNNIANAHLVVAEAGEINSRRVLGRTRTASSNAMSEQFPISESKAGEQFNARVGGDPFGGSPPSFFCVVWEHAVSALDHNILARLVDQATSNVSGPVIPLVASTNTLDARPAIGKSNASPSVWTVVWERTIAPANGDIFASQINFDGTVLISPYAIDTTATDARNPSVSSLQTFGDYMVVYEIDPVGAGDIRARVYNGAAMLGSGNLTVMEGVAALEPRVLPAVESSADRFVVATSQQATPLNANAYISTFCFDGDNIRLAEPHRTLDVSAAYSDGVRLASVAGSGGGAGSNDFMITWANRIAPGTFGTIQGARYQAKSTCCASDVVINAVTNVDDLLAVITGWGACLVPTVCPADVNGDAAVNVDDLLAVISGWGPCP